MICNQQTASAPWQSYSSMMASIKPEPQSYGQYGGVCQQAYPNTASPYSSTGSPYTPHDATSTADDQLDNDLQDIKLEELDNLDNEINEFVLNDARSLEQMRSSVSPQSHCSSDIDCAGSPLSATDSWYDQRVPSISPYTRPETENTALYMDSHAKHIAMPQHYHHHQQHAAYTQQQLQQQYHQARYVNVMLSAHNDLLLIALCEGEGLTRSRGAILRPFCVRVKLLVEAYAKFAKLLIN